MNSQPNRWKLFKVSVFFVLGFSVMFALAGVLLQTVLSSVGYTAQTWLGRIGGIIIIFFGLFMVGLIRPSFLEKEYKFHASKKFTSSYLNAAIFGAAFALGWSPCVTAALGAILGLAAAAPSSAFILLMAYTLGLGIPFLLIGAFTSQSQKLIRKISSKLNTINKIAGGILIILGILVFTGQLTALANSAPILSGIAGDGTLAGQDISGLSFVNILIALFAGLVSFLSPCVLPLVPGYFSYLAIVSKEDEK